MITVEDIELWYPQVWLEGDLTSREVSAVAGLCNAWERGNGPLAAHPDCRGVLEGIISQVWALELV